MILPDVNILVYSHRKDAENHLAFRKWLENVLASDRAYGMSDLVLSGFLRIVTHPRVFKQPTPLKSALAFMRELRGRANCVIINPGPRHWEIFTQLCSEANAKGNLVPDAYLAALAIESGSEWITTDADYRRFPGLKCRHPFKTN